MLAFACLLVLGLGMSPSGAASKARHHPEPVLATGSPAPTSMNSATGVSCPDLTHCWAVGFGNSTTAVIDATTDGAKTWRAQGVPTAVSALAGVSCASELDCMAVGSTASAGAVLATTDGGKTWAPVAVPSGALAVTAVDCTAKHTCLVLATDGASTWSALTTDGGAAWVQGGDLPPGMVVSAGLSCPSPVTCLVAGYAPTGPGQGAGEIATTANEGANWAPVTLPTGVGILRTVACAATSCIAAGTSSAATTGFVAGAGQLLTSSDGGATWQVVAGAIAHDDAFAAACPGTKVCVVVGTDWKGRAQPVPSGGVDATIDSGLAWRPATLRYVPVGLSSVSCPTLNRCVAAGGDVVVQIVLPVPIPAAKPAPGKRPAGIR